MVGVLCSAKWTSVYEGLVCARVCMYVCILHVFGNRDMHSYSSRPSPHHQEGSICYEQRCVRAYANPSTLHQWVWPTQSPCGTLGYKYTTIGLSSKQTLYWWWDAAVNLGIVPNSH